MYLDNGVQVVDVDGDGFNDVLVGRQETHSILGEPYLGKPGIVDLLVEHTNPLGGRSSIEYAAATGRGLPAGRMPFVRTVAVSLTRDTKVRTGG